MLRVLMTLLLAPLGLYVVYAGGWPLVVVTAIFAFIAAIEWTRMTTRGLHMFVRVVLGACLCTGAVMAVWRAGSGLEAAAIVSLAACVAATLITAVARGKVLALGFGALYVSLPFAAFAWLRWSDTDGKMLLFALLAIVWTTDIAAYFAGRGFGGPLLSPKDSPNKTWTGAIGAIVCASLAGAAVARGSGAEVIPWIAASLILSTIAQGGDLLESRFKRLYGVKDTSGVIPGHGGVLDRLDALMAASLALALVQRFAPNLVPTFPSSLG